MKRGFLVLGAAGLLGLTSACGANCQSTCQRIYSSSECNIAVAGFNDANGRAELIRECVTRCEGALDHPGELGNYDPNDRTTSGDTVELRNEVQAAAWMDCVESTACEQLSQGFCAPI